MSDWTEEARKYQQTVYDMFGDREFDAVARNSDELVKKVICSMYGMPRGDNFETNFGYTMEQYEKAIAIVSCIMDECAYGDKIFVHFLHVVIKLKDSGEVTAICVFKIPKNNNPHQSKRIFLEVGTCRKYDGWSDYLNNNKLPKCLMCYPKHGIYQVINGKVIVEFQKSPACNILPQVADVTGQVASLAGSAAVAASLFFPISTPFVVAGACVAAGGGALSTGRAIYKLVDRGTHGESVELNNSEARLLWIETFLSSISVVTTGIAAGTTIITRSAGLMAAIENTFAETLFTGSKASQFVVAVKNVVRFLECSGLILNTLGLAACIINLVDKFMNNTLDCLDLAVLGLAVFFIANIVICSDTARRLIQRFTMPDCAPFQMTKYVDFKAIKCIKNLCFGSTPAIEIMVNGIPKVLNLFFEDPRTRLLLEDVAKNVTKLLRGHITFPNFCIKLLPYLKQLVEKVFETMRRLKNDLYENSSSFGLPSLNVPLKKIEINHEDITCPLVQFSDKEFYLDIFYGIELNESYCMEKVKLISNNALSERTHYFKLYPGGYNSKAIVLIKDDHEMDAFIFNCSIGEYNVFIMKAKAPLNTKIEIFENMTMSKEEMEKAKPLEESGLIKNTVQFNERTKLEELEEKIGITDRKIVEGYNFGTVTDFEVARGMSRLVNEEINCPLVQFSDKEFYLDIFYGIELNESYCMEKVKLISNNALSERTHYFKLYPGGYNSKAIVLIKNDHEMDAFIFYYSIGEGNVFIMKAKAPLNTKIEILENMTMSKEEMEKAKPLEGSELVNIVQFNECTKLNQLEEKIGITDRKIVEGYHLDTVTDYEVEGCMLRLDNVSHLTERYLEVICGIYGRIQMFSMGDPSALVLYRSKEEAQYACKRLNGFRGISAILI